MKATIRIASPKDAPAACAAYAYHVAHSTASFNEAAPTVEGFVRDIADETYPFLVAEDETGRFLGYACAEPFRTQTGYRYCAELTIFLSPDAPRHSGVGAQLYRTLLDCLTRQGFRQVFGVVTSTNEASLALHRSFGFTEAFRLPRSGYKLGQWLDCVCMVKTLNPFDDHPAPIIPFSKLCANLEELS